MSNSSITEMMKFFSAVSEKTFSQTTAGIVSRIGPLKKVTTYALMVLRLAESMFSSESLREGLKTFFNKHHPHETSLSHPPFIVSPRPLESQSLPPKT